MLKRRAVSRVPLGDLSEHLTPAADELPPLPAVGTTRDGQVFTPAADRWELRRQGAKGGRVVLQWEKRLSAFSPRALHLAKVIIAARMPGQATTTARNDNSTLCAFSDWLVGRGIEGVFEWSDLAAPIARDFLAHGMCTNSLGNDFARLRDLYRYGVEALRHTDFSTGVLLSLEAERAAGNAKGNAVRQGDPEKGYLTPPEIDLILAAVGKKLGRAEDRALVMLCLDTGRNGGQYVQCTNGDLSRVDSEEDAVQERFYYQLRVPRQKKRSATVQRQAYPISSVTGALLWGLRQGGTDDPLLWWLDEAEPEQSLRQRLNSWALKARIRSPRTGTTLHLNARRFRVTLLTQAADEGASAEKLALLADHTDLQNIRVYLDRSPHFLLRVKDHVDAIYDPLVKRFKGELVSEEEVRRRALPVVPGLAPQLPTLALPGIGGCGSKTLCKLAPPITCYSCEHFVGFVEADHRAVETALVEYMRGMGDRVALQLSNALAAVREVIREQDAQRTEVGP